MSDTTAEPRKLLLVDDDREFLEDAISILEDTFDCIGVSEPARVLDVCARELPDAVLLDLLFSGKRKGHEILTRIKEEFPYLPVIMWTQDTSNEAAFEARKRGAFFTVHKTPRRSEVMAVVEAAIRESRVRVVNRTLRAQLDQAWGEFVFASDTMRGIIETAERVAQSDEPVLITGKTGVGKGVLAREIHARSPRARNEFVPVDCGALTYNLINSELFGHVKGTYTDAKTTEPGLCDAADGGTLFLDEVGDMPLDAQAKLRRLVEDKEIRPVGGQRWRRLDVRIIAATNKDLHFEVAEGRFRKDLYYRLKAFHIEIPELKDRPEDVPVLASYFARACRMEDGRPYELAPDALLYIQSRDWPGNVRELQNAVKCACQFSEGPRVTAQDFWTRAASREQRGSLNLAAAKADFEREHVIKVLRIARGNVTEAARLLGVARPTVYRLVERLGLSHEDWRGRERAAVGAREE